MRNIELNYNRIVCTLPVYWVYERTFAALDRNSFRVEHNVLTGSQTINTGSEKGIVLPIALEI